MMTGVGSPVPIVLDAHQHVDVRRVGAGEDDALHLLQADFEARMAMMSRENIAATVLMPSYDYDKRFGTFSTQRVLDALSQYQSWDAERIRWLGLTVEPQYGKSAVRQLEDALNTGVFKVVSWHNRYQGLSVDHPIMFEFVALAGQHNCVVYLHGTNSDHEELWRIGPLVRAFPEVRFVVVDALMVGSHTPIIMDLMTDVGNIWVDTAGATTFVNAVRAVGETAGWDKLLFGSDVYDSGRGGSPMIVRHLLDVCGLDTDAMRKVCGENLVALMEGSPVKSA